MPQQNKLECLSLANFRAIQSYPNKANTALHVFTRLYSQIIELSENLASDKHTSLFQRSIKIKVVHHLHLGLFYKAFDGGNEHCCTVS